MNNDGLMMKLGKYNVRDQHGFAQGVNYSIYNRTTRFFFMIVKEKPSFGELGLTTHVFLRQTKLRVLLVVYSVWELVSTAGDAVRRRRL
jgi:hypothetical protein